jgi:hypothetical protein
MDNEIDAKPGTMSGAVPLPVRRTRRAPQAVSIGLLAVATIMGVHLVLDAPTISPVSPAAIAARYGLPSPEIAAASPAAPDTAQADAAPATQMADSRGVQGRQRGRHDGGNQE